MKIRWVSLPATLGLSALLLGWAGPAGAARTVDAPVSQSQAAEHHADTASAPLTRAVQKAIQSDEQLRGRNVSATADLDGKVTLTGAVTTQAQKQHATDIAETVRGVTAVDNKLAVTASGSLNPGGTAKQAVRETGQVISDDWITTKVKSQLIATGDSQVRVSTEFNVVTLSGAVVTPAEREKVVAIARTTDGVSRVVDELKIAPPKK